MVGCVFSVRLDFKSWAIQQTHWNGNLTSYWNKYLHFPSIIQIFLTSCLSIPSGLQVTLFKIKVYPGGKLRSFSHFKRRKAFTSQKQSMRVHIWWGREGAECMLTSYYRIKSIDFTLPQHGYLSHLLLLGGKMLWWMLQLAYSKWIK